MPKTLTNWAGNISFSAQHILQPTSVDELQAAVRGHRHVKVLGTGHSFNGIADSTGALVKIDALPPAITLDPVNATVRAAAGITFGYLGAFLHERGFSIPNMASLPHISLGGAFATGTHGSGVANPVLAASVSALELVKADGELVTLSRAADADLFDGVVVGLGALGVVVSVTLDLVPAFDMTQDVYLDLPFDTALADMDELMAAAYSVSLFADWRQPAFDMVWCKRRVGDPVGRDPRAPLFGARPATTNQHPIPGLDAVHCTDQLSRAGPAHERLPHFRMDFLPSHGDELQTEYFLPRRHAAAAFDALRPLQADIASLLLVNEIRTIARDSLWMSLAYERDSVAFHFTWKPDWTAVQGLLEKMETALAPFEPRPHWGKVFTMSPQEVRGKCPRLADFRSLAHAFDPVGKFRNRFLDTYVFG